MTETEWRRRSRERIAKVVKKARKIHIRDLKRVTHYNRADIPEPISTWYDALDDLVREGKVREEGDYPEPVFVRWIG